MSTTDRRFVTIYRVPNPAPRRPLYLILTADGREIDGVVSIGIYGRGRSENEDEFTAELSFEGGRDETVRARFAVLRGDLTAGGRLENNFGG